MRNRVRSYFILGFILLTTNLAACGQVNHGGLSAASTTAGQSASGTPTPAPSPVTGDPGSPTDSAPSQYEVFVPDLDCLGNLGATCQVTIIQFKLSDGTLLVDSKALSWPVTGSHLNDMLQAETDSYQFLLPLIFPSQSIELQSVTYWVLSGQDVMDLAGTDNLKFMLKSQRDLLNKVRQQFPGQQFVFAP